MKRFAETMTPGAPTRVAVVHHPAHPMLVTFPIAFLIAVLPSDLAYLYLGDPFWARLSLWLVGAGAVTGGIAGAAGTLELLLVREIRYRVAGWSHFIAAVMLLAVAVANWTLRIGDPGGAIAWMGLYLSALGAALVGFAGWLGGALVFEHQVGVANPEGDAQDGAESATESATEASPAQGRG